MSSYLLFYTPENVTEFRRLRRVWSGECFLPRGPGSATSRKFDDGYRGPERDEREVWYEDLEWINLAQDRKQRWALVNTVTNPWIS